MTEARKIVVWLCTAQEKPYIMKTDGTASAVPSFLRCEGDAMKIGGAASDMDKYKEHFWRNIRAKLEQWERAETITYEDVYRFFHNIAGTAAVIGMEELGEKRASPHEAA